jgi:hypothetical protein
MAFGKAAGCLILAGAAWVALAQPPGLPTVSVRHEHVYKSCVGLLTMDNEGVTFTGEENHHWHWKYQDIQELSLSPEGVRVLTYSDSKLRLGGDREYEFAGNIPAADLYPFLKARMDQRLVARIGGGEQKPEDLWSAPVKHLRRISGSEGELRFGPDQVTYATAAKEDSRTWRYSDIESISSSGPFQLTITTFERARSHYGDRKGFNFQLKQPITEASYNQLWLEIEKKNGRLQ